MIEKAITYTNHDGVSVTETFHFNLGKDELVELAYSTKGGMEAYLREIVASNDNGAILAAFKNLISLAVGRKSEDGRRFIKSKEITDDFLQTNAYSEMLFGLFQNAEEAAEFLNGVIPAEMREKLAEVNEKKEYTDEQLLAMTDEQFFEIAGTNPARMTQQQLLVGMHRKNRAAA